MGFRWPDFRLGPLDWEVLEGQSWAVVGPSGGGKTTLLRLLSGELPSEGELQVLGQPLQGLGEGARRRLRLERIGMVFQDFPLMEALDAAQNVLLPLRLAGRPAPLERALALLEALGVRNRRVEALSQGERQRVAIARAVINDPGLILADEPTSGLDPKATEGVMELLLGLQRTLVVVTHDPAVQERLAHRLVLG